MTFALKCSRDPAGPIPGLRSRIAELDPELPLYDVRTMQERPEESLTPRRSPMLPSMVFGLVALFLAQDSSSCHAILAALYSGIEHAA